MAGQPWQMEQTTGAWSAFPVTTTSTLFVVGGLSATEVFALGYFHTTVGSNPWAIFTNQVAALYYF